MDFDSTCQDGSLSNTYVIRPCSQSSLLDLNFRWPPLWLIDTFRKAIPELAEVSGRRAPSKWVGTLVSYLNKRLRRRLLGAAAAKTHQMKWILREESALSAMLLHMEPAGQLAKTLRNRRRSRTVYSTYPTSPIIGQALAKYVCDNIAAEGPKRNPIRILDPSMEGAPLLLETAFEACSRAASRSESGRWRSFILSGVDQNPASPAIAGEILRAWKSHSAATAMELDLQCQDAFEALGRAGALDAVVNNPPWGASTDGANGERLSQYGPYAGYRDPYIAFASSALRKLDSAAPFGFVLPFQVLTAASAGGLRLEFLENSHLDKVVLLPRSAFPRATVRTVMLLGRRRRNGERQKGMFVVRYPLTRRLDDHCEPTSTTLDHQTVAGLGAAAWMPVARSGPPFFPASRVRPLGDLGKVLLGIEPYGVGRGCPKQTSRELRDRPFTFAEAVRDTTPIVRSRDISRFVVRPSTEHVRMGPWLVAPRDHLKFVNKPRVFVRQICSRDGSLVAAVAPRGVVARYGVFTIVCERIDPIILCVLLNSRAVAHFVRWNCPGFHKESFGRVTASDLRVLSIPEVLIGRSRMLRLLRVEAARVMKQKQLSGDDLPAKARAAFDALIDHAFGVQ